MYIQLVKKHKLTETMATLKSSFFSQRVLREKQPSLTIHRFSRPIQLAKPIINYLFQVIPVIPLIPKLKRERRVYIFFALCDYSLNFSYTKRAPEEDRCFANVREYEQPKSFPFPF